MVHIILTCIQRATAHKGYIFRFPWVPLIYRFDCIILINKCIYLFCMPVIQSLSNFQYIAPTIRPNITKTNHWKQTSYLIRICMKIIAFHNTCKNVFYKFCSIKTWLCCVLIGSTENDITVCYSVKVCDLLTKRISSVCFKHYLYLDDC